MYMMYYKPIDGGKNYEPCSAYAGVRQLVKPRKILHSSLFVHGKPEDKLYCEVSTVFLVLDHSHSPSKEPVLYETMIFSDTLEEYQEKYCTYDASIKGHIKIVDEIKASLVDTTPIVRIATSGRGI